MFLPSADEARQRYLHHVEDAGSDGHRKFLWKAIQPSMTFLYNKIECLDFGCGPVPVLASLLSEIGISCDSYDPNFDFQIPENKKYDHVFCLETAEHFIHPWADWQKIFQLLKPGGTCTLMTERYRDKTFFSDWYYKRDKTHVGFYHERTIQFLAARLRFEILFDDGQRVTVFRRKDPAGQEKS